MDPAHNTASKALSSPFLLDPAKLTRILRIAEERFRELHCEPTAAYEVKLTNGKHLQVATAEELLDLDNRVADPIRSLQLTVATPPDSDTMARVELSYTDSTASNIEVSVTGPTAKWVSQCLDELDEQLDRTRLRGLPYKINAGAILGMGLILFGFFTIFVGLGSLAIRNTVRIEATRVDVQWAHAWLESAQRARAGQDVEQKLDALLDEKLRHFDVELSRSTGSRWRWLRHSRTWFVGAPILLILGCSLYALHNCYPRAVFNWGDYADHYLALVDRRGIVWRVIVGTAVVGVFANLFSVGVFNWSDKHVAP